jgi:hypothetical protein
VWPRRPYEWIESGVLHISVPFTWNLPDVQRRIRSTWMPVRVGGPAVELMPDFLKGAQIGHEMPDVLQRINPLATRTTTGCPSRCGFCAVPLIEGRFAELESFPPGPVVCDNNLLAASWRHLERVVRMLRAYGWADFNQGLDASLMTPEITDLLVSIGKPICRFAVDSLADVPAFDEAYCLLRRRRLPRKSIRVYCLIGYNTDPSEAWKRCRIIEQYGIKPLPMWFHELDALEENTVTKTRNKNHPDRPSQRELGWSDYERRRIMQWFYKHKEAVA